MAKKKKVKASKKVDPEKRAKKCQIVKIFLMVFSIVLAIIAIYLFIVFQKNPPPPPTPATTTEAAPPTEPPPPPPPPPEEGAPEQGEESLKRAQYLNRAGGNRTFYKKGYSTAKTGVKRRTIVRAYKHY